MFIYVFHLFTYDLEVKGEWEFRGHGVSSCAACDGYLYKGKACAVIGGGDSAMEEALMLARICSSVELLHRRACRRESKGSFQLLCRDIRYNRINIIYSI